MKQALNNSDVHQRWTPTPRGILSKPTNEESVRGYEVFLYVIGAIGFIFLAYLPFYKLAATANPPHWDYAVYRAAALCRANGLDPREIANMRKFGTDLPWNYGPIYSLFFLPPFALPAKVALLGFVSAKFAALGVGIAFLQRTFQLSRAGLAVTGILVAFGFSGAAHIDFQAGNISAFEFPLVCAVLCLSVKGKLLWTIPCVLLLALGKPPWLLFGFVPFLVRRDPGSIKIAANTIAAFLVTQVLSIALFPADTVAYWKNGLGWHESNIYNPTLREFLTELSYHLHLPIGLGKVAWVLASLGLMFVLAKRWIASTEMRLYWCTVLIIALPVFLPRVKPYSMMLMVPFVVAVLATYISSRRQAWPIILLALGLPSYAFWEQFWADSKGLGPIWPPFFVGYVFLYQCVLLSGLLVYLSRCQQLRTTPS